MTQIVIVVITLVVYCFYEWSKYEREQERKARIEYVSQKQNSKIGFCAECYYHKSVSYSKEENFWLCNNCK
ncbi:hypothetical protein SLL00_03585 [Metabacillus indicus]|uniref:hypothetical protein n=1 Tax=Metabacillus indicus TaxID=246786 RepID=UPI002A05D220|nr:hypothetical protein [Metabacillus indicus]MDX8288856.1 hypothetical protein [Metabacillus indicus]